MRDKQVFSALERRKLVKPIFEVTGCLALAQFIAVCMVEAGGGAWKRVAEVFRQGGALDKKVVIPRAGTKSKRCTGRFAR